MTVGYLGSNLDKISVIDVDESVARAYPVTRRDVHRCNAAVEGCHDAGVPQITAHHVTHGGGSFQAGVQLGQSRGGILQDALTLGQCQCLASSSPPQEGGDCVTIVLSLSIMYIKAIKIIPEGSPPTSEDVGC